MSVSFGYAPRQPGGSIFTGKTITIRRRLVAMLFAGLAVALGLQSYALAAPGGRGNSGGSSAGGSSFSSGNPSGRSSSSSQSQGSSFSSTPKTDSFRLAETKSLGDFKKADSKPLTSDTLRSDHKLDVKAVDLKKVEINKVGDLGVKKLDIKPIANVDHRGQKANDAVKINKIDHLLSSDAGKKFDLTKQLKLADKGDVARQMNLFKKLNDMGGWKNHFAGKYNKNYFDLCFNNSYCGPFTQKCYQPHWCGWIDWCYFPTYDFWCDYRPLCCRPIYCVPCNPWVYCNYPVFYTLPTCDCGTWVDVAPVAIESGLDIQCLAVRFVDNGHAEKELGPRYRVWVRNNSKVDIRQGFDVLMMASMDDKMAAALPHAGSRVASIKAGETISLDIRLPFAATSMGHDLAGAPMAFNKLHVVADARNELKDINRQNNGAVVARTSILPVDPAVLNVEKTAAAGSEISLAGEGLGPEGGKVIIDIAGTQTEGEIQGWTDVGARVKLPSVMVNGSTDASIVMVRGDGAATSPVSIKLVASNSTAAAISGDGTSAASLPVTQLPE